MRDDRLVEATERAGPHAGGRGWIWENCDCALCGAGSGRAVLLHAFDESSYYRCSGCGLVYLNPRLSWPSMKQLYQEESYYSGDSGFGYETYEEDVEVYRRTFERRFRELARFKPAGRLLDVGCGTGLSVTVAAELGYEAHGLDASEYATSVACAELGSRIRTGTLETAGYPDGHFDAVTMFDLFEHLYDPVDFTERLARITAADGIVAIATPDYDSWIRRLLGARSVSFKVPEHVCYYDRRTLEGVVGRHFRIVHVDAIGQYCTPSFLQRRLAAASPILGWLYRITLGWTGWQPYVPSGSMFVVLKKRIHPLADAVTEVSALDQY